MSVTIQSIEPEGKGPLHDTFLISGVTDEGRQNVQVYYEIPSFGVQSANLRAISDDRGYWCIAFSGPFKTGTEVTAYARNGAAELAWKTQVL